VLLDSLYMYLYVAMNGKRYGGGSLIRSVFGMVWNLGIGIGIDHKFLVSESTILVVYWPFGLSYRSYRYRLGYIGHIGNINIDNKYRCWMIFQTLVLKVTLTPINGSGLDPTW